jgi:predicted DNA-binding protein
LGAVKRTNINLRDDQHKKLGTLSEKTGAPMSALIRKAIDEYLKKKR